MTEINEKPQGNLSHYIKWTGAFSILIVCFMAGFTISHRIQSSEVSTLKNELDRKEKAFENIVSQLNIVTAAFERYRKQSPYLNDDQQIEENNKLKIELQNEVNRRKELSTNLLKKEQELNNAKNELSNALAKVKEIESKNVELRSKCEKLEAQSKVTQIQSPQHNKNTEYNMEEGSVSKHIEGFFFGGRLLIAVKDIDILHSKTDLIVSSKGYSPLRLNNKVPGDQIDYMAHELYKISIKEVRHGFVYFVILQKNNPN